MPALKTAADPNTASRDARRLSTLLEVSQALSGTLNLKASLQRVLSVLARHHGAIRGMVTVLRDGELQVEAAEGFEDRARSVRYRVGEGITGKVVESGKPIVVPRVSREPALLNRAAKRGDASRQELSFICVPIVLQRAAVGALAVDLRFKPERDFDSSVKFFGIVSSMIAQALAVQRQVEDERRRLLDENTHLRQELRERYDFSNIIGTSGPTRQMYEQVAQVAQTNTTVLIRGESGTGKELIAHAIHYNSLRAKKPFVKVSCAALPETLIESELFGYEKGAFTGAAARKKGRFEMAEGGTLFLDEIGDINPSTQVKLLRVLQEREFERLGGTDTVRVNVRMIAATNKDMEKAIGDGTFREDLYYRLNVFTIFVPPLRDRKADMLLLADHFLEKFSREHGKVIKRISTPAIDMLMSYHWPGNVRELENALERAVLVCDGAVIHGHHLPPSLQTADASGTVTRVTLKDAVAAFERDLIQDALKTTRGNRAKAARLLDTTERILNYKVRGHSIDPRRFKSHEAAKRATAPRPRTNDQERARRDWPDRRDGRVGCGKKGAPLAPFVRIPAAVETITASRLGSEVFVTVTVPMTNIDKSVPIDISRIDVYGYTGRLAPTPARWASLGTVVASIPVVPPAVDADNRPLPQLPTDEGAIAGSPVTIVDPLAPEDLVQGPVFVDPRLAALPPLPEPPAPAALRRFYLAIGFSQRGRPGPPGAQAELALTGLPDVPSGLRVAYATTGVSLTWEPSGGLLGFLLDRPLPPEPLPYDSLSLPTRLSAPAAAAPTVDPSVPPGPTTYHVYRELAPDPLVVPPSARPAWSVPAPAALNPAPLTVTALTDTLDGGRTRCYTIRAQRGTVLSDASPPFCVTPIDVFPPAAPTGLAAVPSEGGISLIWEPNAELDLGGYLVLRRDAGDATLRQLTNTPIVDARYRDTEVQTGTRYTYWVVAVDSQVPLPNVSAQSQPVEETAR